jgi:hypothetical protein
MLGKEHSRGVDYRIFGGFLYRFHGKLAERIIPWGPRAGAWTLVENAWEEFAPELDLTTLEKAASSTAFSALPISARRTAASRFLIARWPQDARDAVRIFPSEHWQLLQFLNHGGAPARELLLSNPALGYLAAVSGAASQAGVRRRSLAAAFGFPETGHAVRLLAKVPTAWISSDFLAQLRAALAHDDAADSILTHLTRINPIALEVARRPELCHVMAPDLLARLSRMPAAVSQCDLVSRMEALVESAQILAVPPPRLRQLSDLDRPACPAPVRPQRPARVAPAPRPARGHELIFPSPPLPDMNSATVQITPIRSVADLVSESDIMHHCAGREKGYTRRVAGGRLYFYRMIHPERLTIAIRPIGAHWVVEQVRGKYNQMPGAKAMALITHWLHA